MSAWTSSCPRGTSARAPPDGLLEALPARSREVADLLIQGKQNKWIAWKLGISRDTVKYHVRRVYSLLGVSSRVELLRLAIRNQDH